MKPARLIPSTLDAWVKQLDAVRLPIPLDSHKGAFARRSTTIAARLRGIAELMQDSPALALSPIRDANHHTHGSLSEPAESLEVAINRLGLARTQEMLERLPALPWEEIPQSFRQIQMISQHAAQQASGLFGNRLARLWQSTGAACCFSHRYGRWR